MDLFGQTGNTGAARRGIELRGFHGWQRIRMQRQREGRRARKERGRERWERRADGGGATRGRTEQERGAARG